MIKPRNPFIVLIWSFGLYILIHATQYVGCLVASTISGASFESIISGEFSNHLTLLGQGVTAAVLGIPFIFIVARFLWRRPWSWVCLHLDVKLLSIGLIFGIGFAILALASVGLLGDIYVTATPDRFGMGELLSIILGAIGWVAFIAILEEFIFRGIVVREWATKWGWPVAILLGGVYFGAVHIIGLLPNIDYISILWIMIASSVGNLVFVALYLRGKSLWLPIGFHAGWNLSLTTMWGVTMSGQDSSYGLFIIETSGNDFVTGGKFGIEASVIVMVVSIIVSVLLLRYSRAGNPRLLNSAFKKPTTAL